VISVLLGVVCFCIETMEDVDADERWQQYWHDNGEQLVWNDWLQKYPEYTGSCLGDSHSSSAELSSKGQTDPVKCQLRENNDSARNGDEALSSNKCDVGRETTTPFVNGQTCCLDGKQCERSQSVSCNSHVEAGEQLADSSIGAVNTLSTDSDVDSLVVDALKQSHESDISDSRVIVCDHTCETTELSDGTDVVRSWDSLWEQHHSETYWYYYDWFVQWLQEERDMLQPYILEPSADTGDDVQQTAAETYGLGDDLLQSSYPCNDHVSTNQESRNVVESLMSELLLSVIDHNCPADGSGEKHQRKKGKQHQQGLFDFFCFIVCAISISINFVFR